MYTKVGDKLTIEFNVNKKLLEENKALIEGLGTNEELGENLTYKT